MDIELLPTTGDNGMETEVLQTTGDNGMEIEVLPTSGDNGTEIEVLPQITGDNGTESKVPLATGNNGIKIKLLKTMKDNGMVIEVPDTIGDHCTRVEVLQIGGGGFRVANKVQPLITDGCVGSLITPLGKATGEITLAKKLLQPTP